MWSAASRSVRRAASAFAASARPQMRSRRAAAFGVAAGSLALTGALIAAPAADADAESSGARWSSLQWLRSQLLPLRALCAAADASDDDADDHHKHAVATKTW